MWTKRVLRERSGKVAPLAVMMLLLMAVVIQQAFSREVVPEQREAGPAGYTSLAHLVELIGVDAAGQFSGFFDPGPVRIEPFPVLGEFPAQRISLLGATLADQMAAVINSVAAAPFPESNGVANGANGSGNGLGGGPVGEQVLRGVIQELDGYLRVHVSGRNSRGHWRSYVAGVEMNEAVYRAMHTYVSY